MYKFILKFYFLFIVTISVMFFSLVFYQKQGMDRNQPQIHPPREFMMNPIEEVPPQPMHPMSSNEPSPVIPFLFIIGISSIFILCFLRYIGKSYVKPLTLIQENLKSIKNDNFDIVFENESESYSIQETFNILNEMVIGLKEKEKLQKNFIQTLVHDLRAPITAQERAISILQEEFDNHELLEGLMLNNEKYLKMINLIIESYSEKKISIEKTDVNLFKVTNSIVKELEPVAKSKNIEIKNNISNDFFLFVDFISINRIMMNLLSNSIENIPNDKKIEIKGIKGKNKTRLIIEDNGNGIEESVIKNLFEKYSSTNTSKNKIVSGLGLFIVKDLVCQNGGTILVESEVGKYTRFIIEFPNKGK